MNIDGAALARAAGADGECRVHRHLCRVELDLFEDAARKGEPMLVGCTQEVPLFLDALEDIKDATADIRFANIRETAGWSDAGRAKKPGKDLTAKMAALLAEAALDLPDASSVSMISNGVLLVLGRDDTAVEAAKRIAHRMDVTVILEGGADVVPPAVMDVPIFAGAIKGAKGHLGAFELRVENFRPAAAASTSKLEFTGLGEAGTSNADLILDLRGGTPLFPAPEKRDGYFNPDPKNPALVMEALLQLTDMVGEFEKPRYVDYDPGICAHASSRIVGCAKCIDICPTGAITPNEDKVRYDPYVCAGCGLCATVCPTGAAKYTVPAGDSLSARLRTLIGTYRKAGGAAPTLLIHDAKHGQELIALSARAGRGLPADTLPFAVNQTTQVGLDAVFSAFAFGAKRVLIALPPHQAGDRETLEREFAVADVVLDGLGYGKGRIAVIEPTEPDALEDILHADCSLAQMPAGDMVGMGRKRSVMRLALDVLHRGAPNKVDEIALPAGAPFGEVVVDTAGCTLCLSCVGACPTGALKDNPDLPQLNFAEDACVQCGLCRNTCPEKVITLSPRLSFRPEARSHHTIKEEQPFLCIRCGKPFATHASIERLTSRLKDHVMFQGPGKLDRMKMCDTCRIVVMTESADNPLAAGVVPIPKTTDDYLRERERLREAAAKDMKDKGLDDDA